MPTGLNSHNSIDPDIEPLVAAIRTIPDENFSRYPGGWNGKVSVALVDAVFSIGAKYHTKNGKGVGAKVKRLVNSENMPDGWIDSLKVLSETDEALIREVMGSNYAAPNSPRKHFKSKAVIQAAKAMRNATGIDNAEEMVEQANASPEIKKQLKGAYISVLGLSWVTFDYFLMLLGIPATKADRMITRFVANAYEMPAASFSPLEVRELVIAAHEQMKSEDPYSCSLTEFDHAIWLVESEKAIEQENRPVGQLNT